MASQSNLSVSDLSEEEYHRDIAILMVPGIVIFSLLMLIGLFGNILVLLVYTFRLKRSTINLFIIALAASDTVFCSVCIPFEIVVIRYLYTFDNPCLCRVLKTVVYFCVFCSASVLISIAVDRYKRICTPFTKQITIKSAKTAIAIGCVVSAMLASPAMVILGSKTVNRTFTGHACETDDNMIATPYPGLFNGMQLLIAVGGTLTLTVLYSLILRKVKLHERQIIGKNRSKTESGNTSSQLITLSPVIRMARSTPSTGENTNEDVSSLHNNTASLDGETVIGDDSTSTKHTSATGKSKHNRRRSHKTTFMMFLVTAVVVVSFIPHLGLMATRAVQKHTFEHLEGATLALYNIFLRIYFTSSVANPIIYSFLSDKFREQVKLLFKKHTQHPAAI